MSGRKRASSGKGVGGGKYSSIKVEEEEYIVERILDKRSGPGSGSVKGRLEYLIKWLGYPESDNTWEPVDHLPGSMVTEFEVEFTKMEKEGEGEGARSGGDSEGEEEAVDAPPAAKKGRQKRAKATGNGTAGAGAEVLHRGVALGFDRGLTPQRIIGATDASGELSFLMKWEDSDAADLVPAAIANVRCPQVVIKFYEERLRFDAEADAAPQ